MKRIVSTLKLGLLSITLFMMLLVGWYVYVEEKYQDLIFASKHCPKSSVAMILGTSKYIRSGHENLFYRYRMDTAKALHSEGKVTYWLVSGDNSAKNYNEPKSMREDLIKMGVPSQHIQPDYAGFRTLDSIYRMEKVFGNKQYLIVSQPFHLARAVFIAKHRGHDVVGCAAPMPSNAYALRTRVREVLARVKLFLDLYVLNTQAKYYGQPVAFP